MTLFAFITFVSPQLIAMNKFTESLDNFFTSKSSKIPLKKLKKEAMFLYHGETKVIQRNCVI